MSYGLVKRKWFLDEEESRPFIKRALELGINFFDTANMYGDGQSEEVTGRALRDFAKRDEVVIATKVFFPMRPDANGRGLSRKAIMTEIDNSLRRLGTDYVDLYQIHRWDYETPIEETLEALHDVLKAGKARYIGASSMFVWQFCKALYFADLHGRTRFVSMQPHYNLLYREEEREMLGLCSAEGIGVIPWSPLARGRLTRSSESQTSTTRAQTDEYGEEIYSGMEEADKRVIDRVGEIAEQRGVTRAQMALAWLFHKPVVTAPIIGATKLHHLEEAVAALAIKLSEAEIEALEAPYIPHPVVGFE
jgi:aryl-alcohol dehydrogenase-like predicted oxidoreductase